MSNDTRAAWAALDAHRDALAGTSLRELFAADPARFERFSVRHGELLLDYSKCGVTADTMALLMALARAAGVEARRDAMLAGEKINVTEARAVLHVALRNRSGRPIRLDGRDVMGDVNAELARLGAFADGVRSGKIAAADGRPFTDIVNIGIGGSDLGPAMATAALAPLHDGPRAHFVSNVDGAHLADTLGLAAPGQAPPGLGAPGQAPTRLAKLDPARTLFVIASKTFATIETMTNAHSARAHVVATLGEAAVGHHFAAVSTALEKVAAFGIGQDRVFGFWDWVGGRYSIWSAIGLPLMIAIGPQRFTEFLAGAHDIDEHFRTAPPERNLPMLLGLLSVWHRAVCRFPTRAIIPYDQRLARFPAYLQQLEMESNGKRVALDGRAIERPTGAVVWGAPGTDAQHSFFQLLHQGTDTIPAEFLIAAHGHAPGLEHHHQLLIANCLAQSEALALGRTTQEARALLLKQGATSADADRLAPHKTFRGNRPSLTLAYPELDPAMLGRLIALYEHRVFVEAAVHGINAYDQWGVELGKELAVELLPVVAGTADGAGRNGSTRGLVAHLAGIGKHR